MRMLAGLIGALALPSAVVAAPTYLSCTVRDGSLFHVRFIRPTAAVDFQWPDQEETRTLKATLANNLLSFSDSAASYLIDLTRMTTTVVFVVGGEGHSTDGTCIQHPAADYAGADTIWSPRKPGQQVPRPKGNPEGWISADDLPADLEGKPGDVNYVLTIGPGGKVEHCLISRSSGLASLDDLSCVLLRRRGRFRPALDEAGQPTTGFFSGQAVWRSPGPR